MLDEIFGENNFRNEIIWKRASTVKGNAGQGSKLWSPNTDSIFFYTGGSEDYTFHPQFKEYTEEYLTQFYKYTDADDATPLSGSDLTTHLILLRRYKAEIKTGAKE